MKKKESPALNLLTKWCENYSNRDLAGCLSLLSSSAELFFWGTGKDEECTTIKGIKECLLRDWAQSERGFVTVVDVKSAHILNPWASIVTTAQITINNKTHHFSDLRISGYASKEGQGWKIVQMHISLPALNQKVGNAFPSN